MSQVEKIMPLTPKFNTTNNIIAALVKIERTRGFLEAARVSDEWIAKMQAETLIYQNYVANSKKKEII